MSFLFAFAVDRVFGWTIVSRVRFFPASGACRLGRAVEASVSFSALESSARSLRSIAFAAAVLRCRPRSYYRQLVSCFAHVLLRADVQPFLLFPGSIPCRAVVARRGYNLVFRRLYGRGSSRP